MTPQGSGPPTGYGPPIGYPQATGYGPPAGGFGAPVPPRHPQSPIRVPAAVPKGPSAGVRVWRVASGVSVLAVATYLLVEGAQGNEAAIREARTSWINALGGTLGVEGQMMPGIDTVRRATTGWQAGDEQAFEAALNVFTSQLGSLKTAMEYMGEGLGHLADAYAGFDTAVRLMGISLIATLIGLRVARAHPATAAAAVFAEARAVRTANLAVIALLGQLGGFVTSTAVNLAKLRSAMLNIDTALPRGPGAIAFAGAEIPKDGLPPYRRPPGRDPGALPSLPPGSERFDWNLG